jgi:hypothetical protein
MPERKATPEMYARVFEGHAEGAMMLEDLVARFYDRRSFTPGGVEGARMTDFKEGRREVVVSFWCSSARSRRETPMWRRNLYVYRYPDGGAGDGGGGAGAAGAGAGGAGSGAAGGGSAGGGAGAGAAGAGAGAGAARCSAKPAVAAAAGAAAAGAAAADPNAWLPEKYRVFEGDGDAKKLNVEASAKKMAEGHTALEKRMGDTGLPPEKPEGYKNEAVLETLKKAAGDKAAEVKLPEAFLKDFNAWAHTAKLTQAQRDAALVAYMQGGEKMVEQAFDNAMASAQKELVKVWGADGVKPDSPQMKARTARS